MVAVHTAVAIVLVIVLIIKVRVDPVISLVLGSLYLGLAAGVGFAGTIEAITVGFGGIMAEVGLLIGFGVLIGALLHSTGAFRRLVGLLVKSVGATRLPYALTSLLAVVMPSIYVDVQVVLAAPVARSASPFIGRTGLPTLASALGGGIFAGYVFVIPGLAALSIAGLLDIQLGDWLLYGLVIGLATAVIATLLMQVLFRAGGFWDPATDEEVDEALAEQEAADATYLRGETDSADEAMSRAENQARETEQAQGVRRLPLVVLMLPILVPLVLIAFGAFAELGGWSTSFIAFLGDANLALFVGLLGAYLLTRMSAGAGRTGEAMTDGFHTTGEILLITGVGGSLVRSSPTTAVHPLERRQRDREGHSHRVRGRLPRGWEGIWRHGGTWMRCWPEDDSRRPRRAGRVSPHCLAPTPHRGARTSGGLHGLRRSGPIPAGCRCRCTRHLHQSTVIAP